LRILFFLFSSLAAFFSGVILSDTRRFQVHRYYFRSKKVKKNAKFVVITDLHGREFGEGNKRLVAEIKKLAPDFVLMGGDIMTAKDRGEKIINASIDVACALVKDISAFAPVYYALGNHESRVQWSPWRYHFTYRDMLMKLKNAGAKILDNDSTLLKEYGIRLHGLTLPEQYYKMSNRRELSPRLLQTTFGSTRDEYYHILLAHDPEYLPVYAQWGPDLSFSGHYHGGIMQLPGIGGVISPKLWLFPDYCGGLYHLNKKDQVVSRGIGTHTFPIRVFNPAELLYVEVRKG